MYDDTNSESTSYSTYSKSDSDSCSTSSTSDNSDERYSRTGSESIYCSSSEAQTPNAADEPELPGFSGIDPHLHRPLYSDSRLTVLESYLLLLQFVAKVRVGLPTTANSAYPCVYLVLLI